MKHWKRILPPVLLSAVAAGLQYGCKGFERVHLLDFLMHLENSSTVGVAVGHLISPKGVAVLLFLVVVLLGALVRLYRRPEKESGESSESSPTFIALPDRPRKKARTVRETREIKITETVERTVIDEDSNDDDAAANA